MEHCKKMKWSGVFKNSKWFARTLRRISSCELKGFVYYDLDRKKNLQTRNTFYKNVKSKAITRRWQLQNQKKGEIVPKQESVKFDNFEKSNLLTSAWAKLSLVAAFCGDRIPLLSSSELDDSSELSSNTGWPPILGRWLIWFL